MKLLFDENLSFKLCKRLADLFPDSDQVRLVGLTEASDPEVWHYAGKNGFALVSLDADFAERAILRGTAAQSNLATVWQPADRSDRKIAS
jgi:predicted nuclease of predicted toxin-antitoxin system